MSVLAQTRDTPLLTALVQNKKQITCNTSTDLEELDTVLSKRENKDAEIVVDVSARDVYNTQVANDCSSPLTRVLKKLKECGKEAQAMCRPIGNLDDQTYVAHYLPTVLASKHVVMNHLDLKLEGDPNAELLQKRYNESLRINRPC
jgi:hypothetical protein